jgi:ribosomal protein L31
VREGIHPKYHEVEARCACGAKWKTKSTKHELDTEGRVERFSKKFGVQTSESRKVAAKAAKAATASKKKPAAVAR